MKNLNLVRHTSIDDIIFPVAKKASGDLLLTANFATDLEYCVHLEQQNKITQFCGNNYQLIKNEDLFLPVHDKLVSVFGSSGFDTKVESYDDRRFYVEFEVRNSIFEVIDKDELCPVIRMRNSYDGWLKQSVSFGYNRLICTNGLTAFDEEMSFSKKHHKLSGLLDLNKVLEQIETIEIKIERFKKLTDRVVTPQELETILKTVKESKSIKYPAKMLQSAKYIAQKEAAKLQTEMNAWLVYNGLNYPLNHHETKLLPEEASKIDSKVLASIEKTLSLN
ncbi:MAG: DUF932 domain-containing protein [Pseudomonadota bacterium]